MADTPSSYVIEPGDPREVDFWRAHASALSAELLAARAELAVLRAKVAVMEPLAEAADEVEEAAALAKQAEADDTPAGQLRQRARIHRNFKTQFAAALVDYRTWRDGTPGR